MRKPSCHNQYSENILVIVCIRYLIALPKLVDVGLRVWIFLFFHPPHIALPHDSHPHQRVEYLEQGF